MREETNLFNFFRKEVGLETYIFDSELQKLLNYQISKMHGSVEHPVHHPEKYLYTHICKVFYRGTLLYKLGKVNKFQANVLCLAALFHDITKHGYCYALWGSERKGQERTIAEGTYYQNPKHDEQARQFVNIDFVKKFIEEQVGSLGFEYVEYIVYKHMKNKLVLDTFRGLNDMKPKKIVKYLESMTDELRLLNGIFSGYMDNMKVDDDYHQFF